MNVISSFLAQAPVTADTTDQRGMLMSIIIWLFIGAIAGFIASKIVNKTGEGLIRDIILGLIGSFVGGFLFNLAGIHAGGLGMSILVATIGAIIVLVIFHMLVGGRRPA